MCFEINDDDDDSLGFAMPGQTGLKPARTFIFTHVHPNFTRFLMEVAYGCWTEEITDHCPNAYGSIRPYTAGNEE